MDQYTETKYFRDLHCPKIAKEMTASEDSIQKGIMIK